MLSFEDDGGRCEEEDLTCSGGLSGDLVRPQTLHISAPAAPGTYYPDGRAAGRRGNGAVRVRVVI